jgi:MoxR-like ATPase
MKASLQASPRHRAARLPLAVFHAPLPGEDVELFSDRKEDAVEYDAIVHEFEALYDAEDAPAGESWV